MEQKCIKIFLASSNEISDDREKFGNFVRRIDKIYSKRGLHLDLFEWEDYDAAYRGCRKQDEYDDEVRDSDMFVALFYVKGGEFTIEEFNVAIEEYRKRKSPLVYVYFRDLSKEDEWSTELKAFTEELKKIGLFWYTYGNQDQLRLHFLQQLLIVENVMLKLELENGEVKLGDETVAQMDNLPFAKGNKDYQRINAELLTLPGEIDGARKFVDDHPDNDYMRGELQKKLNRYNALKKEFARLQKTLFETSQRIARMQREQLSDKLRRATEAFEAGNMERANTLLDEIEREAETHYAYMNQYHEFVHQDIEAFLLRAKTRMTEVNTPIKERIKQVQGIYAKADQWAKDSALPDKKYDGLLFDYSKFLYDYGLYKEAEPVYLRLIALREKLYGKEHANTATSYNNIGALYKSQGNYTKALEYYEKALDIKERVLGPDTATSYNNIGVVYYELGANDKALENHRRALDIYERVLGPGHPNTAQSYINIGWIYRDKGNYDEALKYCKKALDICKRKLDPDQLDTAQSYNDIGGVYKDLCEYDKASEYCKKAMDIYERVLGPDHPYTASSYYNIGVVYYEHGENVKALEFYEKALDIWERKLGPDHPDTRTVRENIERCRRKMQG
jgi:tetratricopeptide (TPR) repeat protein